MLFSAGGIVSAMLVPILLLLFGVAYPLGWVTPPSYEHLRAVMANPLTRLVLLVLCALSLFHAGHRFRHTVKDAFQVHALDSMLALLSYGGALLGSAVAAYLLLQVS
jgi:fumarate reductase subunit D